MTTTDPFVIISRGRQSNGAMVGAPGAPLTFDTRAQARTYADSITPDMPSKNLPLVVVRRAVTS